MTTTPRRLEELARLAPLAPAPGLAGALKVRTGGQTQELLLADASRASQGVACVDWRNAPIAQAFFGTARTFEYEAQGRRVRGSVLARELLELDQGELRAVVDPVRWLRTGARRASPKPVPCRWPSLSPRPQAMRGALTPPAEVILDAAQRAAVDLPAHEPLLVLGEAGAGKTTVALHRLARLLRKAPRLRAAAVVPTEGLAGLLEALLVRMGLRGVDVFTYERWAGALARRTFPDLPRREGLDATAGVIQLKRHAAVRTVLAEVARLPPAIPDEDDGPSVPSEALARWHDLQRLFGDRAVLEQLVRAAPDQLRASALAETFAHTRIQFSPPAEVEFAHIDRARLETLDGRRIDEDTPMQDAGSIDPEDYAVLFELERLRAQRKGSAPAELPRYDCLVVDEAQELAPLELALLGRCVAPGGTLIVAGDAEQQVDPTTHFLGWPAVMAELGVARWHTTTLDVSYRCPAAVTRAAREVVGRGGAGTHPVQAAARQAVASHGFPSELHLVTWLIGALRELGRTDPKAAVAVICRTPEAAHRLVPLLRKGTPVRLALEGHFALRSGVSVTCVQEVKGLEFDHVVIPDADAQGWPDTPESRRALYVALTRPTRQLLVAWHGTRSPLWSAG